LARIADLGFFPVFATVDFGFVGESVIAFVTLGLTVGELVAFGGRVVDGEEEGLRSEGRRDVICSRRGLKELLAFSEGFTTV
jgi:hypothetical protein